MDLSIPGPPVQCDNSPPLVTISNELRHEFIGLISSNWNSWVSGKRRKRRTMREGERQFTKQREREREKRGKRVREREMRDELPEGEATFHCLAARNTEVTLHKTCYIYICIRSHCRGSGYVYRHINERNLRGTAESSDVFSRTVCSIVCALLCVYIFALYHDNTLLVRGCSLRRGPAKVSNKEKQEMRPRPYEKNCRLSMLRDGRASRDSSLLYASANEGKILHLPLDFPLRAKKKEYGIKKRNRVRRQRNVAGFNNHH